MNARASNQRDGRDNARPDERGPRRERGRDGAGDAHRRDFLVGSTFSSVGGLDLGLERAGMRVVFQAEVEEWRRRVLRWHWPDCRIYDDVRAVGVPVAHAAGRGAMEERRGEAGDLDLLCGGFPCQDLSVAGKRRGLAGERSGLFFEFARIADEFRPRWLLVENVPGLLSSADGRDFAIVLRTLGDLGYGLAWRVLDARFFGVPQRRRRVFIVGHFGGESEPAVRALGAGGFGDSEARGCSWQGASGGVGGGAAVAFNQPGFGRWVEEEQAVTLARRDYKSPNTVVSTLQASGNGRGYRVDAEAAAGGHLVPTMSAVRRLTPVECERLMSWPATLEIEGGSHGDIRGAIQSCRQEAHAAISSSRALQQVWGYGGEVGAPSPGHHGSAGRRGGALLEVPHGASPEAGSAGGVHRVRFHLSTEAAQAFACLLPGVPEGVFAPIGEPSLGCHARVVGWTAIDGDKTPDSRRYAACGDGVVSNVAEWIGRGIMEEEAA